MLSGAISAQVPRRTVTQPANGAVIPPPKPTILVPTARIPTPEDAGLPDANRVSKSVAIGSYNMASASAKPNVVRAFPDMCFKLSGVAQQLSSQELLFRTAKFFGVKKFNGAGNAPTANDGVVYLGWSATYQPIQIQPYAGLWSYELASRDPHLFDASTFWILGASTDGLYVVFE